MASSGPAGHAASTGSAAPGASTAPGRTTDQEPSPDPAPSVAERRAAVRAALAQGQVADLRALGRRLRDQGLVVGPDDLRGDLRALGAIRVAGPDGPVLAVPVADAPSSARAPKLATDLVADPDWPIQVAVVAVAVAFLLVALLGWFIAS